MKAFKLVISLLMIPRLFGTLLLMPLLLSLLLVTGQSLVTKRILSKKQNRTSPASGVAQKKREPRAHPLHRLLLKAEKPLGPLQVCNWELDTNCKIERFDLVIRPQVFNEFPAETYHELFDGKFRTLHVCEECTSEIVIDYDGDHVQTHVYSPAAYALVRLVFFERARYILEKGGKQGYNPEDMLGDRLFHAPGFVRPANLREVAISFTLLANVALLIMCALWLALKAHRKVLDYFVGSGALMPLVAATGKGNFYAAIWILTLLRVGAFLLMAIPVVWVTVGDFFRAGGGTLFYYSGFSSMMLWVVAIFSSMGLAMMIGSIADLKHRHFIVSFVYKLVPFVLAMLGGLVWGSSFLLDVSWISTVRNVIGVLPICGLGPLLVAPIFPPPNMVLIVHAWLSVMAVVVLLNYNARWFAVHLDDF